MKIPSLLLSLILSAGSITASIAAPIAVSSVQKDSDGVTFKMQPGTLKLRVFSPRVVEVIYALGDSLPQTKSLSVIGQPKLTNWKPGMLKQHTFHIVWVSPGKGVGVSSTTAPDAVVSYDGTALDMPAKN